MIKRVELFGFNFISEPNMSLVVDDILKADSYEKDGNLPFLITPNVDYIVKFSQDEYRELRNYFLNSSYILPDGQPIVLASKFFKHKIAKRLAGSDLLPLLWNESKTSYKILALTSGENVSVSLQKDNPNAVCYTLPFFDLSDAQAIQKITDDCVKILLENNIKIVVVGISFPKQNILTINIYNRLKELQVKQIPLFCMLGASFEFYLQFKKRAPLLIQKTGFEWLHRVATEPKRLFKRYFIEGMGFFPIFFKELLRNTHNK